MKKVRKHFLLGGHLIPERLYEREKYLVRDDSSNGISSHVAGGLGTCDRFARKEVLIERAMKSKKLPFKRVAGVTLAVDHEANKAYWPLTTSDFLEPLSRLNAEDFTSSSGLSKEHSNRKSIGWLDSRSFLQQYVLDRFLHKEGVTLVPFVVDVDPICHRRTRRVVYLNFVTWRLIELIYSLFQFYNIHVVTCPQNGSLIFLCNQSLR